MKAVRRESKTRPPQLNMCSIYDKEICIGTGWEHVHGQELYLYDIMKSLFAFALSFAFPRNGECFKAAT